MTSKEPPAVSPVARHALYAAGVIALSLLLRDWPGSGSSHLHTVLETIATLIAAFVAVLALLRYRSKQDNLHLMLGAGFLGTALLDGYHTLVSSDAFDQYFPSAADSLYPWSWFAPRVFLALALLLTWWGWHWEATGQQSRRISEPLVYAVGGALTLATFLFFVFVPLPRAYYPELPLGRPEELIPAVLFAVALVGFLRDRPHFAGPVERSITDSLVVGILTQAVVMSRSFALFDAMFDLAHLLKISSYSIVLAGMLASVHHLFREHEKALRELVATNAELAEANRLLARWADELNETNQLLRRRNEELDRFAYIVSHDLKAPLRAIASLASWLKEDYADRLDEDGRQQLTLMIERAERMSRMIDAILAYSRAGRTRGNPVPVDTRSLLAEIIDSLETPRGIRVRIEDPLPTVVYDPTQLRQVFQNLIDNAIKHMDKPEGEVTIACRDEGRCWRFEVRDTGPGIAPQHFDRIFEMFQTLRPRDQFESTGIGLAIVKRIVERNGGTVSVVSELGRGSCFTFTIPKSGELAKDGGEAPESAERRLEEAPPPASTGADRR